MNLSDQFAALKTRNEKALVLFVTAGDPPLDQLPAILDALQEGGADVIELGLPFSDPIADGPTIQASSQRALDGGVTPGAILETLGKLSLEVPVVAMGYYNTVLRKGLPETAKLFRLAGINGTIISDLIPEESDAWVEASRGEGLDNVFLCAPTSTEARLAEVCKRTSGFAYAVSRTGVTGAGQEVPPEVKTLVERIRQKTSQPICVGFGISTPAHVRMVCEVADGAVIGSWLVNLLAQEWDGGRGRESIIRKIRDLKEASKG